MAKNAHLVDSGVIRNRDIGTEFSRRHLDRDSNGQRAIGINRVLNRE